MTSRPAPRHITSPAPTHHGNRTKRLNAGSRKRFGHRIGWSRCTHSIGNVFLWFALGVQFFPPETWAPARPKTICKVSKLCCIFGFKVWAGWGWVPERPRFSVVFTFATRGFCLSKFNLHHFGDLRFDRFAHVMCLTSHAKHILSATTDSAALREWNSE